MTRPYFASYTNSLYKAPVGIEDKRDLFTHYEIQTVREFVDGLGNSDFSVCWEEADCADDHPNAAGPVLFGVYGRQAWGGACHITDFTTLELAEKFLTQMGIPLTKD